VEQRIQAGFESQNAVFWMPVKNLLRWPSFIRHQEAFRIRAITTKKPSIPIFVSHRWIDTNFPDPKGNQRHIIIRFLIEAICLSRGICERFFSYAEPEIVLNPRLKRQIKNHQPDWAARWRHDDDPLSLLQPKETTEVLLARWLHENFPYLVFETKELMAIGEVLNDIGIWYDYTCIPQKPFTSELERLYFEWSLTKLTSVIKGSNALIIWDKQANDRGWCLLEGMMAENERIASYDATPNTNWKVAVFDLGQGYPDLHPNKQIALHLRQLIKELTPKDSQQLQAHFEKKQITCTREEDFDVVCKLISEYLAQT